jgi:MIP family channel proteins
LKAAAANFLEPGNANVSKLTHKAAAEFLGVFALVFFGCGSLMLLERYPGTLTPAVIPVIFGTVVMTMVYALGHISGAHFNPAVTLAFTIARHFPKKEVPVYWAAQFAGGLLAMLLLSFLLSPGETFGATIPQLPLPAALGWEIVLTFFLMLVIMAVATDTRAVGTMAGVAIGAVVMLGAYVGGPLTGASMNPARSLAPALFQNEMNALWLYFVGPNVGAVAAALIYEWIRCDSKTNQNAAAKGCC